MNILIPWGYSNTYKTLSEVEALLAPHYHPEFLRRLLTWLEYKGGKVGIGGHWRETQPTATGFAAPGKSFHEKQSFADGTFCASAVDVVYEDGPDAGDAHDAVSWNAVPVQGGAEAARFGVHANVGTPADYYPRGEAWHIQPVEVDGYDRWIAQGRPAPVPNYPIEWGAVAPAPQPEPQPETPGVIVRNNPPLQPALDALAVVMTYCACNPGGNSQVALWDVILPHLTGILIPAGDPRRTEFEQAAQYPGDGRLARAWAAVV